MKYAPKSPATQVHKAPKKPRPKCQNCLRLRASAINRTHPDDKKVACLCIDCYGHLMTWERLRRTNQKSIKDYIEDVQAQLDKVQDLTEKS